MNISTTHAVNLLPYRSKQRKILYWYLLVLFVLGAFLSRLLLIPVEFFVRAATQSQRISSNHLVSENKVLLDEIVNLSSWERKKHNRKCWLKSVNTRARAAKKANKNCEIVSFLVKIRENLVQGIILEQIHQQGDHVRLIGRSMSKNAMTKFMHRLPMTFFELKQHASGISFVVESRLNA